MTSPSPQQGERDAGRSSSRQMDDPLSPFDTGGLCRHCRGLMEHTAGCIYAREWEKFGGGL